MATKKQKRALGRIKFEKDMAESKQIGLEALRRDQEARKNKEPENG